MFVLNLSLEFHYLKILQINVMFYSIGDECFGFNFGAGPTGPKLDQSATICNPNPESVHSGDGQCSGPLSNGPLPYDMVCFKLI